MYAIDSKQKLSLKQGTKSMIVLCFLVLFPASWYLVLSIPCTPNLALHSGYNYKQSSYWSFFFNSFLISSIIAHHKQNHLKNWNKVPFFFSLHGIHNSSSSCFLFFLICGKEWITPSFPCHHYLSNSFGIFRKSPLDIIISCFILRGYIGVIT